MAATIVKTIIAAVKYVNSLLLQGLKEDSCPENAQISNPTWARLLNRENESIFIAWTLLKCQLYLALVHYLGTVYTAQKSN